MPVNEAATRRNAAIRRAALSVGTAHRERGRMLDRYNGRPIPIGVEAAAEIKLRRAAHELLDALDMPSTDTPEKSTE